MKESSFIPWFIAALFFFAVTSALFYHGFVADFFCITQVLLLLWLLTALLSGGKRDIPLPRSALALFLAAYAGWLALTLAWGTVPNYNVITFWWLVSLPFAFWLYTLSPGREALWFRAATLVLLLALILSMHAAWQFVMQGWQPKSVFLDLNSYAAFIALIALPTAGYFLAGFPARAGRGARTLMLGAAVFVLVFAVALTAGRGAMLVFVTGLGVLIAVAWRRAPRAAIVSLAVLVAVGLVAGNLVAHGATTARLETLVDPETAGFTRFLIWQQTWEIIKESPWLGQGLGAFGLVFPAHQNPLDTSAGFMAHNDYLQIWLEAGLPGLVLLLAVYVSALILFVRALQTRRIGRARAIEMTGLFCGLLAVAMHSFVNFDLYILPTTLVAGVMLARFHELAVAGRAARVWKFDPMRYVRPTVYRVLVSLVVLIGLAYWASHSLANYAVQDAVKLATHRDFDGADAALSRAQRLSPESDAAYVARAELYRNVIGATPASDNLDRQHLFVSANQALDRAEQLNPYRADIPFLRARLCWLMKTQCGADWQEQTTRDYQQAIRIQPRFFTARVELAMFWLERGKQDQARALLEQGMAYGYVAQENIIPYFRLTAALRRQAGDVAGARELEQRIAGILSVPPDRRIVPLDQVKFFSFYDLWRWFLGLWRRV